MSSLNTEHDPTSAPQTRLAKIQYYIGMFLHPPKYKETAVKWWNNKVELPLVCLAILFLVSYTLPITYPDLPRWGFKLCRTYNDLVWFAFLADYLIKVLLAKHRWSYIRYHLFDLIIVAVPFFQPLRLLRLLFLLQILNRRATHSRRNKVVSYVSGAACMVVFVGALAILEAERSAPDSQIHTFGEAIWWALVTITTVGYGDYVPVSPQGKIVALVVMFFGMALVGSITASLASWLVEKVDNNETQSTENPVLSEEIKNLRTEIAQLKELRTELQDLKNELETLTSNTDYKK